MMKKFAGHKTLDQIRAQCAALGLELDTRRYDQDWFDTVVVRGGGADVFFNTVSGRFFGTTDQGVEFSSDDTKHEDESWFQQVLSFFYIEKEPAMSERPVKLQVNLAGAWKDVAFFDAGDKLQCSQVMQGAEEISSAAGVPFRVTMRDGLQSVLYRCRPGEGWKEHKR